MRILLISHTCQSPSEGQPKVIALGGLPGVELRVVVPERWKHYGRWRPLEVLPEAKPYLVPLAVRWPWLGPAQSFLHHYPGLSAEIRGFKPDLIDVWEEPWSLVSLQATRLRDRLVPDAALLCETEQNLDKALPPPFEAIRRATLRRADWLVARNAEAVAVCRRKGYTGPADVLPNAVDVDLFRPMDRDAARRAEGVTGFALGYVGRVVEEKGIADLIGALPLLPEEVNVVIVGEGPAEASLRGEAERLGVTDRVRWSGPRRLGELPSVMNAIDALVLPSRTTARWKEQYGRVLIEALACGTPVLGSDSGAIPEVIDEPERVFAERDSDALTACVRRLMDDPAALDLAAREARRQRVLETTSWTRVAERYVAVYRRAIEHRRRALTDASRGPVGRVAGGES